MPRTRVLVVDDSVVVRRVLADELGRDPDLSVVGTAPSGDIALAKLDQLAPDVVTLDVDMEGMNGLETLARIRELRPRLPVVMFSALTARGAEVTIEALLLGASDYVAKPASSGDAAADVRAVLGDLQRKLRALGREAAVGCSPAVAAPPAARAPATPRARGPAARVEVVVVGVSTGGPNALMEVLPRLPADLATPVLVVQHMPPVFTRTLAQALAERCALRVDEGLHGVRVAPGQVWIAPGDHHMSLVHDDGVRLALSSSDPPENSCRPAADVLFRSAARHYQGVLGVVMTGMGQDGLVGCQHVKEAGGQVLVQDEATSVVWGMPGFVARAGLADAVLPLGELAGEITRRAGRSGP